MLTHLSLFAGIGGFDIAADWAGFITVGQCEYADFPTEILKKHWPAVERWRDIRTLTAGDFYKRTGLRTVNLISGGFPCQPFSFAGKRKGAEDDRFLWPEMVRVIKELRPSWVIGENVVGFVNMELDNALSDLEAANYETRTYIIPACAVNAPHERSRVFIVAHANDTGNDTHEYRDYGQVAAKDEEWKKRLQLELGGLSANVPDPYSLRLERQWAGQQTAGFSGVREDVPHAKVNSFGGLHIGEGEEKPGLGNSCKNRSGQNIKPAESKIKSGVGRVVNEIPPRLHGNIIFPQEPDIPRIAENIKNRVKRLKCLGNAVVPYQVYPIFKAIADIENGIFGEGGG